MTQALEVVERINEQRRKRNGWRRKLIRSLRPTPRVWTRKSQAVVRDILAKNDPDDTRNTVILVGSGHDNVYQRLLAPYHGIIRCGLAHRGHTNLACDVCALSFADDQADLIIASSVDEHVYDPEASVREKHRVLKVGGFVYTEIPFMRAYHMAPIDYQRYTVSGIRMLHERAGFVTLDVGICSGPFTALALFLGDFTRAITSFSRPVQVAAHLSVSLALHPLKYLDRLCESAEWAQVCACNFYYLGRKN